MLARTVPDSEPAFAELCQEDGIGSARLSCAGTVFLIFNDGCKDFAELRALILQARAAAMDHADAVPVPHRCLDIESDEFVMA